MFLARSPGRRQKATASSYENGSLDRNSGPRLRVRSYEAGVTITLGQHSPMDPIDIPHKELEFCRGFLVYVTRTYGSMVPYLKDVYHTLDSWRSGRDADGWKSLRTYKPEDLTAEPPTRTRTRAPLRRRFKSRTRDQPPKFVRVVHRFKDDVGAPMKLTESETLPKIGVR
jgi:hypothetical protein